MKLLTKFLPNELSGRVLLGWGRVDVEFDADILSAAEREECESFKNEERRREYIATRWLIKEMISHLDLQPEQFILQKDELGKPFGRYEESHYHVGIAHTDKHVLSGISSKYELGVDIEPVSRNVPDRLRNRITNKQESALLSDVPAIRLWTLKEALVKLQGQGMRTNLDDCTILSAHDDLFTATLNNEKRAKICSFQYENNWLALAWNHQ